MSSSVMRPSLVLTVTFILAAGSAPLAAQRAESGGERAPRASGSEGLVQQLRRLQIAVDSLSRLFDEADLSTAERRQVGEELDKRVAQFKQQVQRIEGLSADGRSASSLLRIQVDPMVAARAGLDLANALMQSRVPAGAAARGWIGIVVSGAAMETRVVRNELIMRYFAYPSIASVDPSSPAQRAGLAPGDTLLAYNGQDVRDGEISLTRLLRPNAKVIVRVKRDGRVRELPVVVAEVPSRIKLRRDDEIRDAHVAWASPGAPEVRAFPGMQPPSAVSATTPRTYRTPPAPPTPATSPTAPTPMLAPLPPIFGMAVNGVAGAQMVTITDGLGKSLGLQSGVLVASVPPGSPAGESGLRDGDVIVKVDGNPVRSVFAVRELVARAAENGERSVDVEVVREKRKRTVTLRW